MALLFFHFVEGRRPQKASDSTHNLDTTVMLLLQHYSAVHLAP